jgi:hypothetical protein
LDHAEFFDAALFNNASFGGFLLMRDASFRAKSEVSFDNLKVGEDALVKASFNGPVRWNYGVAKGTYYKGSRFLDRFWFDSNKISNSFSIEACDLGGQFICRENKISDDLDARNAHFKSLKWMPKNATAGGSEKPDDSNSPFDVDLFRTRVGGIARFNGAIFDGLFSLERANIEDLDITDIKPWPRKQATTRLAEATVKYFHAGPLEEGGWQKLLSFLNTAEYDEGLYL